MKLFPWIAASLAMAAAATAQMTDEGVIKATVTMLADGRHKSTVVDPDKKTAIETVQDKKGKVLSKTIYSLDERNLTSGASFYDAKDKLLLQATYKRDAADRIQEEIYLTPSGKMMSRRVYTYGLNNKVTRLDQYDEKNNLVVPQPKPTGPGRPDKKKR